MRKGKIKDEAEKGYGTVKQSNMCRIHQADRYDGCRGYTWNGMNHSGKARERWGP